MFRAAANPAAARVVSARYARGIPPVGRFAGHSSTHRGTGARRHSAAGSPVERGLSSVLHRNCNVQHSARSRAHNGGYRLYSLFRRRKADSGRATRSHIKFSGYQYEQSVRTAFLGNHARAIPRATVLIAAFVAGCRPGADDVAQCYKQSGDASTEATAGSHI